MVLKTKKTKKTKTQNLIMLKWEKNIPPVFYSSKNIEKTNKITRKKSNQLFFYIHTHMLFSYIILLSKQKIKV